MSLSVKIMDEMKTAMRAKDTIALEALRAIKSEILLAQTATGSKEEITEADEIKILQKLVKMRKDSFEIFTAQNRPDLAEPEMAQIAVIEKFLPAQLSEAEVEAIVAKIISETGGTREIVTFIGKGEDYDTVLKNKDSSNVSNFENVGGEMKEKLGLSADQAAKFKDALKSHRDEIGRAHV